MTKHFPIGLTTTTISTEGEIMEEWYNTKFIHELRSNLVFAGWGLLSTHPKNKGEIVHWLSMIDFSATPALTEGGDPTETSLSAGDQTAALAQYGQSLKISDILQETWIPEDMVQAMERLARAAALEVDTTIRNVSFTAGGSAQYCGTAVARNSIASDGSFDYDVAEFREAIHSLETLKAEPYPDGFYRGIIHQDVKYDLQGDTANWQEILKHTPEGFRQVQGFGNAASDGRGNGVVGHMWGIEFIMSQQAIAYDGSGSASTDIYQSYVFGPGHYGVSNFENMQWIIKNPSPASNLNMYGTFGYKFAYATKELDSARMIRLEGGATLGT